MRLPIHKTKIVCTIGPASRSEAVLERLMQVGMNVARLNFAHGTLDGASGQQGGASHARQYT
jgi:pyruvate kinase